MNAATIKAIRAEIDAIKDTMPSIRRGVVTTASPLAVAVGGSDVSYTDCKRLASYTPTIGDQVMVMIIGGVDLIVLGKIA